MYAFLARYGHQPISDLRQLTHAELDLLYEEVARLVEKEPVFTLK